MLREFVMSYLWCVRKEGPNENVYGCWFWVPSILLHNAVDKCTDIRAHVHVCAHANRVFLCTAHGLGVKTSDPAVLELRL